MLVLLDSQMSFIPTDVSPHAPIHHRWFGFRDSVVPAACHCRMVLLILFPVIPGFKPSFLGPVTTRSKMEPYDFNQV